ncbi:MAG: DUF2723 domain-containing protein, partial [Myxococcota bacterium]|nr:DUF2723 domain-containing protein [Myxococcota bacterium]
MREARVRLQLSAPYQSGLIAGIVGAFYCLTALPGVHWHDTGEFLAAGRDLSLSHPPGHPLAVQLIHLSQLLPFGSTSLRGNWASALAAMGAAFSISELLCLLSDSRSH